MKKISKKQAAYEAFVAQTHAAMHAGKVAQYSAMTGAQLEQLLQVHENQFKSGDTSYNTYEAILEAHQIVVRQEKGI